MSDLREPKPPILHPPVREPAASDGSPLTVIRDAQGQISEASGTGRDGVFRHLTVTSKSTTNAAGFHFIATQLAFSENGKEHLRLRTILSPDAGKGSFLVESATSQFSFAVGISRARGKATVVTTTGRRVTVDLSGVSLLSAHSHGLRSSLPRSSVPETLIPPQGI